jgi:hypothetical protein
MGGETITVEVRDTSDNARAELEAQTLQCGGIPVRWAGNQYTARAGPDRMAGERLRAALYSNPRVVDDNERDVLARTEAAQERAGHVADQQSFLEAEVKQLQAELEAKRK